MGKNESPVSESQNNNFEVIASDAIDFALITMVNGYAQTEEGANFSGWAKSYYQNVDSLSLLIDFNEGLINEAHSWNPDGEKSPETSLQNGTGVITEKIIKVLHSSTQNIRPGKNQVNLPNGI